MKTITTSSFSLSLWVKSYPDGEVIIVFKGNKFFCLSHYYLRLFFFSTKSSSLKKLNQEMGFTVKRMCQSHLPLTSFSFVFLANLWNCQIETVFCWQAIEIYGEILSLMNFRGKLSWEGLGFHSRYFCLWVKSYLWADWCQEWGRCFTIAYSLHIA